MQAGAANPHEFDDTFSGTRFAGTRALCDLFAQRDHELLRQLRDKQVLVTLYYDQAAGFTVSNVLDVNEGFEELILDRTSDAVAQKSIYASKQLVVVAFLDNVKLQFSVGTAEAVEHHGRPAFRVRFPQQLLRMQRRSSHRRQPPQSGRLRAWCRRLAKKDSTNRYACST